MAGFEYRMNRSLFQLVLLPNDERVMGETHLMDILKDTIKMQTGAPLMYPGYGNWRLVKCETQVVRAATIPVVNEPFSMTL